MTLTAGSRAWGGEMLSLGNFHPLLVLVYQGCHVLMPLNVHLDNLAVCVPCGVTYLRVKGRTKSHFDNVLSRQSTGFLWQWFIIFKCRHFPNVTKLLHNSLFWQPDIIFARRLNGTEIRTHPDNTVGNPCSGVFCFRVSRTQVSSLH